jgi:hypothetical protein
MLCVIPQQQAAMSPLPSTRREFLALLALALVARPAHAMSHVRRRIVGGPVPHPTPRQGITAARVMAVKQLENKHAAAVFDMVREIPEVIDGIHCYCGCASQKGFYSLLSCFEDGMAQHCEICQGEAKLAHRLHADGWSLNGIRSSIDASYADR